MIKPDKNKLYKPTVYFIRCHGPVLRVGGDLPVAIFHLLINTKGVIIWEQQGRFKIIPPVILSNLARQYEAARSIGALYPRITPPTALTEIQWDQGTDIYYNTVMVLLTTENCLGESDTTTDTTGKDHPDQP